MGVSFYQYVYDRESGQFKLPSLAVLIAVADYNSSYKVDGELLT
jgi:hypothetical protein